MKEKKYEQEKLPNIYTPITMNNNGYKNQTILQRNQVIEEYLLSMDKNSNGNKEISLNSEDDDENDPFSLKKVQKLKKNKNEQKKLILPNFDRREKLKSESSSRKKYIGTSKDKKIENAKEKNEKEIFFQRSKNYSDFNISEKNDICSSMVNSKLNSKWDYCSCGTNVFDNNIGDKFQIKESLRIKNNSENKKDSSDRTGRSHSNLSKNLSNYNHIKVKNNYVNKSNKYKDNRIIPNNKSINIYKRNFTAKIINKDFPNFENNKQNKGKNMEKIEKRVFSTLNTRRIIENKHQTYAKLMKNENNPYGLNWINKMLGKNNETKIGISKGFINGVPQIKMLNKYELSKREIKKRLSDMEKLRKEEEKKLNKITKQNPKQNKKLLDDEYNIPTELLDQFNKNSKNFFKFRKDIIEEPEEEEEEHK